MPAYFAAWNRLQNARWLEQNDPRLASAITSLPWIADGIDGAETDVVKELLYIAVESSPAASSIVEFGWVRDGVTDLEAEAIEWVSNFGDAEVMSSLVGLGWVRDGIQEMEPKAIEELSYIDYYDSEVAATVITFPWVQDGVSEVEFKAIDRINHFGTGEVMASVVELGWVQDGIDELEAKAIEDLSDINYYDSTVAASVVALDWVQDGILEIEANTLPVLDYMNYINAPLAASVVALPWVQDGIEAIERETLNWLSNEQWGQTVHHVVGLSWVQDNVDEGERDAISNLYYLTTHDDSLTETIVAFGWVQDGLDAIEGDAIDNLYWISADDVVLAQSVVALHWIRDGVTTLENRALDELAWFTEEASPASTALVALPWVQDGIEAVEVDAIDWLNSFPESDTALRIVSMPFLKTLEPFDASALQSLGIMASHYESDFQRVLAHPTLSNGITDDWAKIVATLHGVSKYDAESIDTLLNPDQVTLEERIIELPLAGETQLAIIRTAPGAESSMDLLEHAVRHAEGYMTTSFPTGYVGYLFGDSVPLSFGGANFGTHIASLAKYDMDDGSGFTDFAGAHVAHEVAHYYWGSNSSWVDEGIANFIASVSENARTDQSVEVTNAPCGYVKTIAELEALEVTSEDGSDSAFICNYALGERLFLDLYRNLGEDSSRQGLQNLYFLSQAVQEDEIVGIEHVRTAFKNVEGMDDQVIDMITARWYDGAVPYDISGIDTTTPNPSFRSVNGRIDVAYLAAAVDGVPTTMFSASPTDDREVWLFLDYSYNVPRIQDVPLELVTYYEDGFAFKRQEVAFDAQPQWGGGSWWLFVGAPKDDKWAEGTYWVHVYNEGRKVVELEYEVTE